MSEVTSEQKMKRSRKCWSCVTASFYAEKAENSEPPALPWEDSICDLSDFVPLAELVRSFQPRDNQVEPEFEYPDGVEPENEWNPPAEYDDIADINIAIKEKISQIENTAKSRKKDVNAIGESASAEKTNIELNSSNPDARVERAENAAKENV